MSQRQVVIPRFQVVRRGEVIRVVPVHRSRLVIGSEDGAHLRLKHPAIAPRHIEVNVVGGRYLEASNLAGEGRVLLGGQPMNRARLREGDELDLGPVSLRLTYERSGSSDSLRAIRGAPDDTEDEPTIDEPAPSRSEPTAPDPREEEATVAGPAPSLDDEPTLTGPATVEQPTQPIARPSPPAPSPPVAPEPVPSTSGDLDVELDEIVLDPTPVVVIEPPGGRPQRVPLRVGSFVVGAGRCAFRLSYPGVAPAHTEMMVMPDGAVYLKHLAGSGLLTLRNGAPIQFSRWMAGDRLQVGPVSMRLDMLPRASAVSSVPTRVGRSTALPSEPAPIPPPRPRTPPVSADPPSATGLKSVPPQAPPAVVPVAPPAPAPIVPGAPVPVAAPAVASTDAPRPTPAVRQPPSSALPSMVPPAGPWTPTGPPPAPPKPAKSLVRVRANKTPRKKDRKQRLESSSSPLVTTNTVSVQLDVTSRDTFAAVDYDDVEYVRPLSQRALLPAIVILLLILIGWQAAVQFGVYDDAVEATAPRTALGASGMPGDAGDASRIGSGPVQIGDPAEILAARRERAAAREGGYDYGGPGNIDWEDRSRMRFDSGRGYDTDHGSKPISARTADEIEASRPRADVRRDAETDAPDSRPTSTQGFVEMKDVERAIYDGNRQLRHCFTQARQQDEDLGGIMWLTLTLATDGRIREVVAEQRSTLKSEEMRSCMARRLYALPMPLPQNGPVTFSYPFEFGTSD